MLEAGLVDKYSHPLDWERAVYDTIMFDKVVAIAQEFCDKNPDTLLIVTGDHTHSISVIGTVDDNLPGELMRDKVGIYAEAGYPAYKDENGDGYPRRRERVQAPRGVHRQLPRPLRNLPPEDGRPLCPVRQG